MIGVILLNMGGPDSLQAVKPFLQNLFSDRDIIRLGPSFLQKPISSLIIRKRLRSVKEAYSLIGGRSPLLDITNAQAEALESLLNSRSEVRGLRFRVYVGMRYWHPFISETLDRMFKDGVKKIVALSLYPHYSIATTGSTMKKFKEDISRYPFEYLCITSWFDHPGYVDSLIEKINECLESFHPEFKIPVLFSAHSLPKRFIDEGDPYVKEIKGTIDAILRKIDIEWYLSYQSKTGPIKWLEPTTEQILHELADKGVKRLVVVPISFVSDHIETLYEIDILYKNMASCLGMKIKRIESLNTSPRFIEALADMVIRNVKERGWIYDG